MTMCSAGTESCKLCLAYNATAPGSLWLRVRERCFRVSGGGRRSALEKAQLVGMRGRRDAAVRAWVKARLETRKAALEFGQSTVAAPWEARLLPDFIEPAGVAGVPALKVHGADSEPARNPDVDRIVLGQRTAGDRRGRFDKKRGSHGNSTFPPCDSRSASRRVFVCVLRPGFAKPAAMREAQGAGLTKHAIRD